MDAETRLELVMRNTEEIITREEMRSLLETKASPRAYWGFEASGMMHIGMGLVCGRKIIDMLEGGFEFIIFLADWHSWINNKLGGRMENIQACGEYLKECFKALGVPSQVRYIWASELASEREYWERVIRVGKSVNVNRIWRALPIMGREMNQSDLEAASTFYPCMQVADIFQMKLDVACAGMDQRKAHALARDVADKLGYRKPTCLHTHLLPGLTGMKRMDAVNFDENQQLNIEITSKMSKSVAEGGVIVHDEPETIRKKLRSAYCPEKETENNPVLEIARYAIFPWLGTFPIDRPAKYGMGKVHPLDLKNSVAESLVKILEPVREEFRQYPQLLEKMKQMEITR
jgi:tyrosyl-tRNA synthetase